MSDNARDARKAEREKREARKRAERTAYVRHLKKELAAKTNQFLNSRKDISVDPEMRGRIDEKVESKLVELADLMKKNKIEMEKSDLMALRELALLYRYYPSVFLEKCTRIEQCINAGIDPFDLIHLGMRHMEFCMSFLYEIEKMYRGTFLAKKRKAITLKDEKSRRFAKVFYKYREGKGKLEKLLKEEFPEYFKSMDFDGSSYNRLKSAYYRAIKKNVSEQKLLFNDLLQFFWEKTAILFCYNIDGEFLTLPYRVVFKSSKTRSKLGIIRDYMFGIKGKGITENFVLKKKCPYEEMWDRFGNCKI